MDGVVGAVIGVIGGLMGIGGAFAGLVATWRKNKFQAKTDELDYSFGKMKETVERADKAFIAAIVRLDALQSEHVHCREEVAALKERDIGKTAEIDFLRKRILAMEAIIQVSGQGSGKT